MRSAWWRLPRASGAASFSPTRAGTAAMSTGTHSLSIAVPALSRWPPRRFSAYTAPGSGPCTRRSGEVPSTIEVSMRDMAL